MWKRSTVLMMVAGSGAFADAPTPQLPAPPPPPPTRWSPLEIDLTGSALYGGEVEPQLTLYAGYAGGTVRDGAGFRWGIGVELAGGSGACTGRGECAVENGALSVRFGWATARQESHDADSWGWTTERHIFLAASLFAPDASAETDSPAPAMTIPTAAADKYGIRIKLGVTLKRLGDFKVGAAVVGEQFFTGGARIGLGWMFTL